MDYNIAEQVILGAIQGIAEWLPVSSEGMIFLVKTNFFNNGESFIEIASLALFLHFGTFLAAFIYFRKDVIKILRPSFLFPFLRGKYSGQSVLGKLDKFAHQDREKNIKLLKFLFSVTFISGCLGYVLLQIFVGMEDYMENATKFINMGVGVLLLVTAYLQFKAKDGGDRKIKNLTKGDSIVLGFAQAFSALPGLSRSGLTVSALLLRKFNEESALKLSFLLSMPIVLAGNIFVNLDKFYLTTQNIVGLGVSFIFGLITINILLRLAKKINFAWFVLFFGLLMIISTLI